MCLNIKILECLLGHFFNINALFIKIIPVILESNNVISPYVCAFVKNAAVWLLPHSACIHLGLDKEHPVSENILYHFILTSKGPTNGSFPPRFHQAFSPHGRCVATLPQAPLCQDSRRKPLATRLPQTGGPGKASPKGQTGLCHPRGLSPLPQAVRGKPTQG